MRMTVVGAGSWGTAFASHLAGNGHDVVLLARGASEAGMMEAGRENARYLPGVPIADGVRVAALADGVPPDTGVVVMAVPSRAFHEVLARLTVPAGAALLSLTKGLEPGTGRRLSEAAAELLRDPGR